MSWTGEKLIFMMCNARETHKYRTSSTTQCYKICNGTMTTMHVLNINIRLLQRSCFSSFSTFMAVHGIRCISSRCFFHIQNFLNCKCFWISSSQYSMPFQVRPLKCSAPHCNWSWKNHFKWVAYFRFEPSTCNICGWRYGIRHFNARYFPRSIYAIYFNKLTKF